MNDSEFHIDEDKFCCVCFCDDHLQDIFLSRYLEHNLLDLIKIYMDIAIHGLLKRICIHCIKHLIRTHNFLKQCKEASTTLRNYLFSLESKEILNIENKKLLKKFKSKLLICKYDLTELEGCAKTYVIATNCDKNNGISSDVVTEDDSDELNVIDTKNLNVQKKNLIRKHSKNCDIETLNGLKHMLINDKSKEILYNDLHNVQKTVLKNEKWYKHRDFANFVEPTQQSEIKITDTTIKVETTILNTTVTTDNGYSDDDDLPLILHRDRSLAVTAQDINEFPESKIKADAIVDFENNFNQQNSYLDGTETKNNDKKGFIRKSTLNSKRKCGIQMLKSERISCCICDLTFDKKSKCRQHLKTEHPEKKSNAYISCDICGKQLKAMCLKTHIKNVHQGKVLKNKFLCPICGKLYNANQRRRHTLLHDTPKPYQCEHCAFRCSQRGNLRRHQRRHTGEKPYLCTVCGHGASQKGTLLEHMKSHDVLPAPVSCVFCQLEFATNFEYRRHRRVHKNDIATDKVQDNLNGQSKGSAACEVDGPLEGNSSGGKVAMDSNLVCPICKKQLMSESGFKCHVRAHKESGRYRCQHCSKSFTSKATLEYHIRIHTGEKPYRCTACPKQFKQPGHLTAHMAIHANRREHRCTYCDQTFNIKFNLVEHLRIHTGDTIDCEFCGKKFRHNSNRRKHIRETHPGEVQTVQSSQ